MIFTSYLFYGVLEVFENSVNGDYYHFPIYTCKEWLLSKNPEFDIELKPLETDAKSSMFVSGRLTKIVNMAYSDFLVSRGKNVWFAETYHITELHKDNGKVQLTSCVSSYKEFLDTSEFLRAKARLLFLYGGLRSFMRVSRDTKAERKKYGLVLNDILKGETSFLPFHTAVGVNIFSAFATKSDYKIALHKRGGKVIEYPNIYHVCPAGTFQPLSCFDDELINQQYSFAYIILREFFEEFFNLEDAEMDTVPDPFSILRTVDSLLTEKDIELIKKGRFTGNSKMKIKLTSLCFDASTFKIEVTAALVFTDPSFNETIMQKVHPNNEGLIRLIDLNSEEMQTIVKHYLNVENFLPAGAVALTEGIHLLNVWDTNN